MIKSYNDILDELITSVAEKTPFTNFNPSAAIRNLLECFAKVITDLYGLLKTVIGQSFLSTATGVWLDLKVQEVGITRRPAVKAQQWLTFSAEKPADKNITIPKGTICKSVKDASGKDYRFITLEDIVLETGMTNVSVLAEAEEEGKAWNVGSGSITRMITAVSGIRFVINVDITSGSEPVPYLNREGSDPESDDQLRKRAIDQWETLGLGGTRNAYKAWAMSVPGVRAVSVLDQQPFGPGTVGVVILGDNGIPTPDLVQQVREEIRLHKPLTADVRVMGPEVIRIDLSIKIVRYPNTNRELLDESVRNAIDEYISGLQLGEGLVLSRIINAVIDVPGLFDVEVLEPAQNIPITLDSFIDIENLNLVHEVKGRNTQSFIVDGQSGDEMTIGENIPEISRNGVGID